MCFQILFYWSSTQAQSDSCPTIQVGLATKWHSVLQKKSSVLPRMILFPMIIESDPTLECIPAPHVMVLRTFSFLLSIISVSMVTAGSLNDVWSSNIGSINTSSGCSNSQALVTLVVKIFGNRSCCVLLSGLLNHSDVYPAILTSIMIKCQLKWVHHYWQAPVQWVHAFP